MADFSRAELVAVIAGQLVAQPSNYSRHSIEEAVGAAEIVDAAEPVHRPSECACSNAIRRHVWLDMPDKVRHVGNHELEFTQEHTTRPLA